MKKRYLIYFFATTILFGCKKDPPILQTGHCQDLPQAPLQGWNIIYDTAYYQFPYFNPYNSNEIIFQQKNQYTGIAKLYKYNLVTLQKQVLFNGENLFQPKWGRNGWILLNPGGNVWKIKSNGDSLTQLTNTNSDYAPEWNFNADKFCFYRSIGSFQKLIISDVNGQELDTLDNFYTAQSCWQDSNLIITTSGIYGLHTINVNLDNVDIFLQQQEPSLISAIWTNNFSEIIYSAENGIFKMNHVSQQITVLKSTCNSLAYLFPTYSDQNEKMIWERRDYIPINNTTIKIKSRLFIMNVGGTEEKEIIIP